ncbi:MAG: SDR family NAD(P)-dependent oxidoreductase [Anaerolineae bacterium]
MSQALITGASSGIGEAFAVHLAHMGYDLIVVARRQERLQALAQRLPVAVQIVVADLSVDEGIAQLEAIIAQQDDVAFLVNNAGYNQVGHFAEVDLDDHLGMIHLHLNASTRLIHAVIPQMRTNHNGAIINVASLGGLIAMPGSATYNATKAYLVSFSESLAMELAGDGIVVQALCPGFTRTEIFDVAGYADMEHVPDLAWMSADEVVTVALSAIARKRYRVIPGWQNQLAWRLMQIPFLRYFLKRYTNANLRREG